MSGIIEKDLKSRYEALYPLGEGGMGQVWAVRDRLFDRTVALKVLHPEMRPEHGRLREEFALLASLDHPGVVRVHDVGVAGDSLYLTADLLEGQRLDSFLAQSPPMEHVLGVFRDILRTLAWLHGEGVVHSDIKPPNILVLSRQGQPWPVLIDFGLAHAAGYPETPVGGTPAFMAPELLERMGTRPTPQSDLYSLGKCFEGAAARSRNSALGRLVARMIKVRRDARPASADAALDFLGRSEKAEVTARHLGGRGVQALWGGRVQPMAEGLAAQGNHAIELPTLEDSFPFLRALKTELEIGGQAVILTPLASSLGQPMTLWRRLLDCMVPGHRLSEGDSGLRVPAPEDQKEALEATAFEVIEHLRSLEEQPVLMWANPGNYPHPDRHVLSRCVEAGVIKNLVLAGDSVSGFGLSESASDLLETHSVRPPTLGHIGHFLKAHGIGEAPVGVAKLLKARAGAGSSALRALLDVWVHNQVLVYEGEQRWGWSPDADAAAADAPKLDGLWTALWVRLPKEARAMLMHLRELGGAAPLGLLSDLISPDYHEAGGDLRPLLLRLAAEGWASAGASGEVGLHSGPHERLDSGAFEIQSPTRSHRETYVLALREWATQRDPRKLVSLSQHLESLERFGEAAHFWGEVAEVLEKSLDPGRAGLASLNAALAAERAGRGSSEVLREAERAARLLEVAAEADSLQRALECTRRAVEGLDTEEEKLRAHLVEVRVAVHLGQNERALEIVSELEARLVQSSAEGGVLELARFGSALAKGTALARMGQMETASEALAEAARMAELLGDLHAVGRVANNLGNLGFFQGRFEEAAAAYSRSAAAKVQSGDVRGRGVAESNRALALRELGSLAEAGRATLAARSLALRVGDRRSEAIGCLSMAQLWLDVGGVHRAEEELRRYDRLPVASDILRLDAEVLRARFELLRGNLVASGEIAMSVFQEAQEAKVAGTAREAWIYAYISGARQDSAPQALVNFLADASGEMLSGFVAEAEAEGSPRDLPLLRSVYAHALAKSGSWDQSRGLVESAASELSEKARPGCEIGHDLMWRAAQIVGAFGESKKIAERALLTVRDRFHAFTLLMGNASELSGMVSRQDLKRSAQALGLLTVLEEKFAGIPEVRIGSERFLQSDVGASSKTLTDPEKMLSDLPTLMADDLNSRVWPSVFRNESPGDATVWAETLLEVVGCESVVLFVYGEDGPERAARSGRPAGSAQRWEQVLVDLRAGERLFVARGKRETVEAIAMPLRVEARGKVVGAALLLWAGEGASVDSEAVHQKVREYLPWAALVVDRNRLLSRNQELQESLVEAERARAALLERHRTEVSSLKDALQHSRVESELRYAYTNIIHQSPGMKKVLRTLDKVTEEDVSVLVLGESGVGKELVARALHFNGPRRKKPFIAENCGAIPTELVESTFFGHVRGAFTGANTAREGIFAAARGGTVFLDEIGELRPEHQVKLLRVLQERRFRPVGGHKEIEADFRIVAATNRDLKAMVARGEFREDLYYRIAVVTLDIPPLRERKEDILPIAQHILTERAKKSGKNLRLSPEAVEVLSRHDWEGNVRALENEIMRAVVLADGDVVEPRYFSAQVRGEHKVASSVDDFVSDLSDAWDGEETLKQAVGRLETQIIIDALKRTHGKKAATAELLALSRPGLDAKLARYGIDARSIRAQRN